ncbi:MAG: hypothetical protein ACTSUC_17850 [Promethearchaeota archaeon]
MSTDIGRFPKLIALWLGGKIDEKKNYKYADFEHDIFILDNPNSTRSMTVFNLIFLNKILFKNYSKQVQDFFFLHEYGHLKMNLFFKILIYPTPFALGFAIMYNFYYLFLNTFIFLYVPNIENRNTMIVNLGVTILVIISFIIINWINEIYAEYFAVQQVGLQNYLMILNELSIKRPELSLYKKVRRIFSSPPDILFIWLFRRIQVN